MSLCTKISQEIIFIMPKQWQACIEMYYIILEMTKFKYLEKFHRNGILGWKIVHKQVRFEILNMHFILSLHYTFVYFDKWYTILIMNYHAILWNKQEVCFVIHIQLNNTFLTPTP